MQLAWYQNHRTLRNLGNHILLSIYINIKMYTVWETAEIL